MTNEGEYFKQRYAAKLEDERRALEAVAQLERTNAAAKRGIRTVLIKWVMDNPDPNDRFAVEMMGCTTPEKAKRIWEILQEPEPIAEAETTGGKEA